jgi:uncharacterized protein (TIGR00369 family)
VTAALPAPFDPADWEAEPGVNVTRTMGWQRGGHSSGTAEVLWDAGEEWSFPGAGGRVVHGGLVSAVLDNAMASASYTVTGPGAPHLTADLTVHLMRPARPGPLVATGTVLRRTRGAVFTEGTLTDAAGTVLAVGRAVQVPLQPR